MIPFGNQFYIIRILAGELDIIRLGPEFFIAGYVLMVLWSILFINLISLIIRTKLTYVEGFRKNFLAGIILLLIQSATYIVVLYGFSDFFFLESVNFMSINVVTILISAGLVIRGLTNLNNYLDSIIGGKEERSYLKTLIISVILSVINLIVIIFMPGFHPTSITLYIAVTIMVIFHLYISISSFYLHQDLKDLKINMMLYFGIGYLFLTPMLLLTRFLQHDWALFYMSLNYFYLVFITFLIIGYLNFKNRIVKIQT